MIEIAFKHCTARKLMPFYPSQAAWWDPPLADYDPEGRLR
jgi:hypothetical protein